MILNLRFPWLSYISISNNGQVFSPIAQHNGPYPGIFNVPRSLSEESDMYISGRSQGQDIDGTTQWHLNGAIDLPARALPSLKTPVNLRQERKVYLAQKSECSVY